MLTGSKEMRPDIDPHAESLVVDVRMIAGTATVVVRGELDPVTTPFLAARLAQILASSPRRLVFNLTGLDYLDCAAARLIAGTGRCLPPGRRPVIRGPGPAVRRVLELTGLDDHCKVEK